MIEPSIHERGVLPVTLAILLLTAASGPVMSAEFHVAANGNDRNPGTLDRPFATITAARDAVRAIKTGGNHAESITVLVRGGIYRLREPLILTTADSGTAEHPIKYRAYRDERPRLTGGALVSNWRETAGREKEADLPASAVSSRAFQDGVLLSPAGWPDATSPPRPRRNECLTIEQMSDGIGKAFFYSDIMFPAGRSPGTWDTADASVVLWSGSGRYSSTCPVTEVDPDALTITMGTGASAMRLDQYCVMNVPQLLDRPGECWISLSKRLIRILPATRAAATSDTEVPAVTNVIVLRGDSLADPVSHVSIDGLDMGICDGDVVSVQNAEHCAITSCTIENGGRDGVSISGRANDVTVSGNLIQSVGRHGVSLEGSVLDPPGSCTNNRIENNNIRRCGILEGHACGIRISLAASTSVRNNLIHDVPRHAVSLKGIENERLFDLLSPTNDLVVIRGLTRDNTIAFNDIHDVCTETGDAGAIDSWYAGPGNNISSNLIRNCGNNFSSMISGICLDDGTFETTVNGNVIRDIKGLSSYCLLIKGSDHRIDGNLLVATQPSSAVIRSAARNSRVQNMELTRNVFLIIDPGSSVHLCMRWERNLFKTSNRNTYWNSSGGPLSFTGTSPVSSFDEWRKLDKGRYDADSIVADPKMSSDTELEQSSPAIRLGFRNILRSSIGLTSAFPASLSVN